MPDRLALIIANSNFDDPKLSQLRTPLRDAEALAEVLGDPEIGNFDVSLLVDEPEGEVRRKIARLYAHRRRSDLLLLYYSGHGIRDEHGDLYLAARDTEMDLFDATALDAAYVRARIDKSGSQRKVVVLDCCHSGAFAGGKSGLGDSVGTEDAFAGSGYGRVILTASDALELAWEGDEWLGAGRPSVFTHFLVEGLRTGEADLDDDGKISLDELYEYVYDKVMTSGHAKQTPHRWMQKVAGQIFIAQSSVVKPAELPAGLLAATESPFAGVRRGTVDELDRLLRGRHPGLALAARKSLERLAEDDSRSVSAAAKVKLAAYEAAQSVKGARIGDEPEPSTPPIREPKVSTRQEGEGFSFDQVISSLSSWMPMWGWSAGGIVLLLFTVAWLSQGLGLWAEPEPTMTPTETLLAAPTQEPTDEPTLTSTSTPKPSPTPTSTLTPRLLATFTPKPEPSPTWPPDVPPPNASLLDTWTRPADEMVMVYVPGGTFQMGSTEGDDDEQPVHEVKLDGFWIDQTEVTNAQYERCVVEGDCEASFYADDADYNGVNYPVVGVSWHDAVAYCEWASDRLPTEAEWEYAARGEHGNIYPWGDEFDGSLVNFCDTNCERNWADEDFDDGYIQTASVGSFPDGASWCDVLDMAGNVWEWVADWYDSEYYERSPAENPTGPETGEYRVVRGGSWINYNRSVRSAFRSWYLPSNSIYNNGFRCVAVTPQGP